MAADDDLDLRSLDDDELVKQMHDDLYDGLREEVEEGVRILLERGWSPYDVLTEVLVGGMTIVGIDFRDGILFVPEVLLAANAMKGGMAILRPLLAETGAPSVGKMVIGTVKGDIHDIGKNLVSMMMEGAGFDVVDLGINCAVEKYLDALELHKPDILGMSALLTTTMPYMKVVIDTLKDKGIRGDYVVLVGGAPLNEAFAAAIGADAYCKDAAVAVETAKRSGQAPHRRRAGAPAPRPLASSRCPRDGSDHSSAHAPGCLRRARARGAGGDPANGWSHIGAASLRRLHNRPRDIPAAVAQPQGAPDCVASRRVRRLRHGGCSTTCSTDGVERLPGPALLRLFYGIDNWHALRRSRHVLPHRLSDAPVRTLVSRALGLDRHPGAAAAYFGNYTRLIYLAQSNDEELEQGPEGGAYGSGCVSSTDRTG